MDPVIIEGSLGPVIRVDGHCYRFYGETELPVTHSSAEGIYSDCDNCEGCSWPSETGYRCTEVWSTINGCQWWLPNYGWWRTPELVIVTCHDMSSPNGHPADEWVIQEMTEQCAALYYHTRPDYQCSGNATTACCEAVPPEPPPAGPTTWCPVCSSDCGTSAEPYRCVAIWISENNCDGSGWGDPAFDDYHCMDATDPEQPLDVWNVFVHEPGCFAQWNHAMPDYVCPGHAETYPCCYGLDPGTPPAGPEGQCPECPSSSSSEEPVCSDCGTCCYGATCLPNTPSLTCTGTGGIFMGDAPCDPNSCDQYCCETWLATFADGVWTPAPPPLATECWGTDQTTEWEIYNCEDDPCAAIARITLCGAHQICYPGGPTPGCTNDPPIEPPQPPGGRPSCCSSSSSSEESSSSAAPQNCDGLLPGCAPIDVMYYSDPSACANSPIDCSTECAVGGFVFCDRTYCVEEWDGYEYTYHKYCCCGPAAECPLTCDGTCATTYMATIGAGSTCCQFMANYFVLSWETQQVQLDRVTDCYWLGGAFISMRTRVYTAGPCPDVSSLISDSTDPVSITLGLTCYSDMWQLWMSWNALPCPPDGVGNGGTKAAAACPVGSYTNGFAVVSI